MTTTNLPATVAPAKLSLPPEFEAKRQEMRARNAMVQALRGTQWGKDLTETGARAMAHYAQTLGLDPVRHLEVLGGKPYLTADFYREKGAPLLRAGIIVSLGPEHINEDARLEPKDTDSPAMGDWKRTQREHRLMLRIQHNVPESVKGAVIYRLKVTATGEVIEGVNWTGGGNKRDPVGDAEPSKTAESRAERRAWRHLVTVLPEAEAVMAPAIRQVESITAELAELAEADAQLPPPKGVTPLLQATNDDPYGTPEESA